MPFPGHGARRFEWAAETGRLVRSDLGEHLLVDRGGLLLRLDVTEGTVLAEPVSLRFELPDDDHLSARLSVIRHFSAKAPPVRAHLQLAARLHALHAVDERRAGASLRQIAAQLLGSGEWPGDGEHRKSLVRRMIASGQRLVREGPRAVLRWDDGRRK